MAEKKTDVKILAIESSCDETAAAVVVDGRDVRSNVISSQIALHTLYGGVVPEIASRKHIEKINQVISQALSDAGMTLDDMDAIAVTYGPGLVGALLVGVAEAKAIAYAKGLPLIGVHHIEGHISANYIENKELATSAALNDLNTNKVSGVGITKIQSISQADYDALTVKDPATLYIIKN